MSVENTHPEIGHVICLTHWDREWQNPVWEQRRWLIQMMDTLLDILDREPGYRSYLLDGQSILIEDYLEFRPENTDRLIQHVRAGRIQIGPWYTLPDEFPVDGECLVRSLLRGCQVSERYGGCMRIGLTTFGWGQTAQLPQIYAGFGIDTLLIGKGISRQRAPENEFLWAAPDGTSLLTSRFGDYGRANFFFHVMLPVLSGQNYLEHWQFCWEEGGLPFHRADEQGHWLDYSRLDQPPSYHPEMLREAIEAVWHSTRDTWVKGHRFLGNGSDFTAPDPRVLQIIEDANALFDDRKLVLSSLPEYVAELRRHMDFGQLRTIAGELRDGPPEASSVNALAIRPRIKRRNRQAQHALIHTAEPLATLAYGLGASYPEAFLDRAWRYLLLAQSHDAINGVTQDKTANDVLYRLDQVLDLANMVTDASLQEVLKRIDLSRYTAEDILLVVFNPLPFPRREIVKAWIDMPREWETIDLAVEDPEGRQLDVQFLAREEKVVPVREPHARPWPFYVDRHAFYLDTGEIPACGYKVLRVAPRRRHTRHALYWLPPEERMGQTLLVEPNALENEHLYVAVQPNGALDVLDKATGRWHRGLHFFEDGGDIGDYWVRRRPDHDRLSTTLGAQARIWSEDCGPLVATLVTEIPWLLPIRADKELSRRSPEERELILRSAITLRRGARWLEIRTTFDNVVEDHRLRVLFPTDIDARFSHAEGHFNVDQRPIDPAEHPVNAPWPAMWTYPQQSFVDISDGQHGLALINDGLCEYEVVNNARHTVALTLLRAVRNEICTEFRVSSAFPHEKGGQSLGPHELRYALYFHDGNWVTGQVQRISQRQNVPLRLAQTGRHAGYLPAQHSLFAVEPAVLVLSALKKAEDRESMILRLYNPAAETVMGEITFAAPMARASLTNLNEEPLHDLPLQDPHHLHCEVPPGKIFTIELEFNQESPLE
jgi:mannosylglycerate hydrolase